MKKGRFGFTLVEILVGAVLMTIVIAGISFGISAALKLYERAESQSVVINGLRFTVDSYNREIVPKLHNTTDISVLSVDKSAIPTSLSDDVRYLYLDGDALILRLKSGDKVVSERLPGSEYISDVTFSIPTDKSQEGKNYLLDMKLTAKYSARAAEYDTDVVKSADLLTALYNVQSKDVGSHEDGDNYAGTVLRFVSTPDVVSFDVVLDNIRIIDNHGTEYINGDVNKENVSNIRISYDIKPSVEPGFAWVDKTTVEWYISGAATAPKEISTATPNPSNKSQFIWLMVSGDKSPLAPSPSTDVVPIGDNFNVRVVNGPNTMLHTWNSPYGVVWCRISPKIGMSGSSERDITGDLTWSPFANIVSSKTDKESLWTRWMGALAGGNYPGFFKTKVGEDASVSYETDEGSGERSLTIRVQDGNKGTSTVALGMANIDLLNEIAEKVIEDGRSYTTLTNMTVIVDAYTLSGNGWGLLMNGTASSENKDDYEDNGYLLQCDRAIDSFPMRLWAGDTVQHEDGSQNDRKYIGIRLLKSNNSGGSSYISGWRQDWEREPNINPTVKYYGPGYMKIYDSGGSKNKLIYDTLSPNGNYNQSRMKSFPWNERQRVAITFLEYYTNDKTQPKFIVRAKYLKPEDDREITNDPWQFGTNYFYSEPIWFGDFVGDKPETHTATDTKQVYGGHCDIHNVYWSNSDWNSRPRKYPNGCSAEQGCRRESGFYSYTETIEYNNSYLINNYNYPKSSDAKIIYKPSTSDAGDRTKNHYVTYSPYKNNGTDMWSAAFTALPLDVRAAIADGNTGYEDGTKGTAHESDSALFANPKRPRYIGLRIWDYDSGTNTQVKIYSVKYAPGFTKEELLAIMPNGARMYEVSDTGQDAEDDRLGYLTLHKNLNKGLFGSDNGSSNGNGNNTGKIGVMNIQHMKDSCTCPMCQNFK